MSVDMIIFFIQYEALYRLKTQYPFHLYTSTPLETSAHS